MKRDTILRKVIKDLDSNDYSFVAVTNMHSCVDIFAKRLERMLAIKVVYNIDAMTKEEADSLGKMGTFFNAEPIVIGAVSKDKELGKDTVYTRFSTACISEESFNIVGERQMTYAASKAVGVTVSVDSSRLRYLMKLNNTSARALAKATDLSNDTIYRHCSADGCASLEVANRMEKALNGKITTTVVYKARGNGEFKTLANTKMDVAEFSNAPFDMVARGVNRYEISYDANPRTMRKRATLFRRIHDTFEGNHPFFISRSRGGEIFGVPAISRRSLGQVQSESQLLNLLTC